MKTYKFRIVANELNAIGKPQKFTKVIQANNFREANVNLYEFYDHIRIVSVNGIKYDPYNPLPE